MSKSTVQNSRPLHPKGIVEIHERAKQLIEEVLTSTPTEVRLTALDAAAGNGFLSRWMHDLDIEVRALDIDVDQWAVPEVICRQADLNARLPFDDHSFDLVVSVETIEHIENPYKLLREFSRVLKPGGHLIVTTPNVHSLKSRVKYLFLGLPSLFQFVGDDHMGQHISPVSMGTFLYGFDRCRLTLHDLCSVGPKRSILGRLAGWLANRPIAWSLRAWRRRFSEDHYLPRLTNRQLEELLRDTILIVQARKQED